MNLVRDEGRKAMRRQRRLAMLKEETESAGPVQPHSLTVEREEERAMARQALDALAERDRDALLMREEGLNYDEIAKALDLSVGSVGTTLSRARRRLMEAYEALQRAPEPA
jgi:RNA polymerase sigma-70 factor (ECF subfamily)